MQILMQREIVERGVLTEGCPNLGGGRGTINALATASELVQPRKRASLHNDVIPCQGPHARAELGVRIPRSPLVSATARTLRAEAAWRGGDEVEQSLEYLSPRRRGRAGNGKAGPSCMFEGGGIHGHGQWVWCNIKGA